ncbi:hypothetical protein [Candidatus Magnetomonas plexicatena]|uniref:hypothetical protein n=1 Tax=Candidatus Magnetomonas plexicatena TaxID=2552947 RepID=UPI001104CC9D|nr:hypothetical protein E2O03_005215 [Nitrospirales bacterium LBB_01]
MQTQVRFTEEILKELQDMPDEQMQNILNLIHIFKRSIAAQRDADFSLRREFDEWDVLSDEALNDYEAAL